MTASFVTKIDHELERKMSKETKEKKLEELKGQREKLEMKITAVENSLLIYDDYIEFARLRVKLAGAIAIHLCEQVFKGEFPHVGVAPLFGLHETVRTPLNPKIQDVSLAGIHFGLWINILKLTDDHPGFLCIQEGETWGKDKRFYYWFTLADRLVKGNIATEFLDWVNDSIKTTFTEEYTRRKSEGLEPMKWRLLDDFIMDGTAISEKGNCDRCGIIVSNTEHIHCSTCKLCTFCSEKCQQLYAPVHEPLCKFIAARKERGQIFWDKETHSWESTISVILKKCEGCGKEEEQVELLMCEACKVVYYCGTECQKVDWDNHKKECKKKRKSKRKN